MKITNVKDLGKNIEREWIITNSIGGYASSTIIGANTRKYHGLLVAPLDAPANRHLVLSKLDESITFDEKEKHHLHTNICKNYIGSGYKYQVAFEKNIHPKFIYEVEGVKIQKTICIENGKNTVGVKYIIKNTDKKAKLELAPILNFRNFHGTNQNECIQIEQKVSKSKVTAVIDKNYNYKIYMNVEGAKYEAFEQNIYKDMFYIQEEKRGFYPKENHVVSGVYIVDIQPNEEKEVEFICSLEKNIEKIQVSKVIKSEEKRIKNIVDNASKDEEINLEKQMFKDYIVALDNFVIYRPQFDLHSVIAGYHWFLDWGRDTLISFEGLVLVTKRFEVARQILKTMVRDVKDGLVPNGYSEGTNEPLYNSVDASLLLFEQVKKYIKYTNDYDFVKNKIYKTLVNIQKCYQEGIELDDNNIYLDVDNLIVSGTSKTQNTWMDAKYNGQAITPRNGKCVEINALWYNANKIMQELAEKFKDEELAKKSKNLAQKCKKTFEEKFYNKKRKCLYDVIDDAKIRPNQLFALSLEYQVIDPKSEIGQNILNTVESKLLNDYGLRSLSKLDIGYTDVYEGDGKIRDFSYHQGITWTWLLGLYYNSLINTKNAIKNKKEKEIAEERLRLFKEKVSKTFQKEFYDRGTFGSIAEIYDSSKPHNPKGAAMQCWSVAEVFRIIMGKE